MQGLTSKLLHPAALPEEYSSYAGEATIKISDAQSVIMVSRDKMSRERFPADHAVSGLVMIDFSSPAIGGGMDIKQTTTVAR